MFKKAFVCSWLAVFAVALTGCATRGTVKQKDMEIQGLKNQVSVLESQIQSKDQEISSLKDNVSAKEAQLAKVEASTVKVKEKITLEEKPQPSVKDIQIALKNAGYDPGKIDGHMGKKTRAALKAFQKANNLKVTGKANKKTWALLGKYLIQKIK